MQSWISSLSASLHPAVNIAECDDISLVLVEEANHGGLRSGAIKTKACLDKNGLPMVEAWNTEALVRAARQ